MRPSLQNKRGQSTAARSGRVVLSHPSSLQGRSDIPLPVTPFLPVLSDIRLEPCFPSSEVDGGSRTSGLSLLSLSPHTDGITPGPQQVHLPFLSPVSTAFPCNVEGRRVALLSEGLSLNRTLSAMPVRPDFTRLHHSLYATVCGFG